MTAQRLPRWLPVTLALAGFYNLAFGALVVLEPRAIFSWLELREPYYVEIWQCLGMVLGVHGIGYLIAARDPARHWVIVLVGLLGKLLGPLGFVLSVTRGDLPWTFGWILLGNDLIWWIPFALLLWHAWQGNRAAQLPAAVPARRAPASAALANMQQILQTLSAPAPTQARLFPDLEQRLAELARSYRQRLAEVTAGDQLEARQLAGLRAAGDRLQELAERTLGDNGQCAPDQESWARTRAASRAALAQFGWSIDVPLKELRPN